jgi:hypothetical protein
LDMPSGHKSELFVSCDILFFLYGIAIDSKN